jgi:hypothetical protein
MWLNCRKKLGKPEAGPLRVVTEGIVTRPPPTEGRYERRIVGARADVSVHCDVRPKVNICDFRVCFMVTFTCRIPDSMAGRLSLADVRSWHTAFLRTPRALPADPGSGYERVSLTLPIRIRF